MAEIWVEVAPGYETPSEGRVRSVDRVLRTWGGVSRSYPGRILKPWKGSSGYLQVYLGRGRPRMIHHLVLQAFHGDRPEGYEGRHLNGDPLDNRACNLKWSTHRENEEDKKVHGTNWQLNKTHCPNNHPLKSPNLVESRLRDGYRLCKACQREYGRAYRSKRPFDPGLADEDYDHILTGRKRVRGGIR